MPDGFEPHCSKTGAFQEIQCHGPFCFCVKRDGIEVPGTRQILVMGKPVCSKQGNILKKVFYLISLFYLCRFFDRYIIVIYAIFFVQY